VYPEDAAVIMMSVARRRDKIIHRRGSRAGELRGGRESSLCAAPSIAFLLDIGMSDFLFM